jgi:hypothetical protein
MGGGGSPRQQIEQFLNINALNKSVMNQIVKNRTTVSSSQNNIQKLTIVIAGNVVGCDIIMNQKISSKNVSTIESATSTVVDMKSQIGDMLKQAMEGNMDLLEGVGDSLNIEGAAGDAQIKQHMNTTIENVIETNITQESVSEIVSEQVNIQSSELIIGGNFDCRGGRGKIDASQDIVAMLSADSVGNMIVDQILADPVVTEATKQIEKNIEKRNNSIPYKLQQFFSSVVGIATIVASVCMCCAFMLLLLVAGGGGNNKSN